jgi:hypothetical protein
VPLNGATTGVILVPFQETGKGYITRQGRYITKAMNHEVVKNNEDLMVGTINYDPEGNLIYDAMIAKMTLAGALIGGFLLGILAYLIASATIPIRDLGQFSTAGNGVATFVGAVTGIAIGGLTGSVGGLHHIVNKNNSTLPTAKRDKKEMNPE